MNTPCGERDEGHGEQAEHQQQPDVQAGPTALSAIIDRRRRRRTSAAEVAEIGLGDLGFESTDTDKWKEDVSKFYQNSTGGSVEQKKLKALDFVAKAAVRQRAAAWPCRPGSRPGLKPTRGRHPIPTQEASAR